MQKEYRLKQDRTWSAHLTSTFKNSLKNTVVASNSIQKKQEKSENNKLSGCYFVKKNLGDINRDCTKYHAWCVK